MSYKNEQLEDVLVALWKAAWNKLSPNMQDLLLTEHSVLRELEEYGENGPVGIGLGRVGPDDEGCIYSKRILIEALEQLWKLFDCENAPDDFRQQQFFDNPALFELDQSGPGGYMGIGLGNPGGHAIGE